MPALWVRVPIPGLRVRGGVALPRVRADVPGGAEVSRDRAVFCLSCGFPARVPVASLDPRRPLVLCAWTTPDGNPRGCGRVPGTYDQVEAARAVRWGKVSRATSRHGRHDTRDGRSPMCSKCHPDLEAVGAVG